jgi:hypothetical protein
MPVERFFFCHIPKTAGTSTIESLSQQFDDEAIYPFPDDREDPNAALDVDRLRTAFEAKGDRIRVIAGHFPLCTTELLGVEFRTFTVLRDPVARTLSHLRYQRKIDEHYAAMSMEQAYRAPVNYLGAIRNMMVKMLGMTTDELFSGALSNVDCTTEHLERAKQALDGMDVVGLTTEYPRFLADLERAYGWNLGEPVRTNTTDYLPAEREFTRRIGRDSALDIRLYQHALDLVASRSGGTGASFAD